MGLDVGGNQLLIFNYENLQSALNAGLAIGAGIGGFALSIDAAPAYLAVFAVDAASFLGAACVLGRLPSVPGAVATPAGPRLAVLRDRPYAALMLLSAIAYLNMPVLSLGLPLWIVGQEPEQRRLMCAEAGDQFGARAREAQADRGAQ